MSVKQAKFFHCSAVYCWEQGQHQRFPLYNVRALVYHLQGHIVSLVPEFRPYDVLLQNIYPQEVSP